MLSVIIPCIVIILIVVFAAKYKFSHSITWRESIFQLISLVIVLSFVYTVGINTGIRDVEVLNGQVTNKYQKKENCSTGWNDYPDSFCSEYETRSVYSHTTCTTVDKTEVCIDHYKTQYKYIYPWEKRWYVVTSFETVQIKRVDSQGAKEPSRWTEVLIGDPASTTHSYDNYMKIAYDNIINPKGMEYLETVPRYPIQNYDYYKSTKVVNSGVIGLDLKSFDLKVREILKTVGPKKQANIIFLFTKNTDSSYRYAVESAWLGGKKNDIVVLIGGSKDRIVWADVITLGGNAGNELFTIKVRDAILDNKIMNLNLVDIVAELTLKHFDRKSMSDFEYLKEQITPSSGLIWICYLLTFIGSILVTFITIKYDMFE